MVDVAETMSSFFARRVALARFEPAALRSSQSTCKSAARSVRTLISHGNDGAFVFDKKNYEKLDPPKPNCWNTLAALPLVLGYGLAG